MCNYIPKTMFKKEKVLMLITSFVCVKIIIIIQNVMAFFGESISMQHCKHSMRQEFFKGICARRTQSIQAFDFNCGELGSG